MPTFSLMSSTVIVVTVITITATLKKERTDIEKQKWNSCFSCATFDSFSFFLDFCEIDSSMSASHGCRFQETSMCKEYHFM